MCLLLNNKEIKESEYCHQTFDNQIHSYPNTLPTPSKFRQPFLLSFWDAQRSLMPLYLSLWSNFFYPSISLRQAGTDDGKSFFKLYFLLKAFILTVSRPLGVGVGVLHSDRQLSRVGVEPSHVLWDRGAGWWQRQLIVPRHARKQQGLYRFSSVSWLFRGMLENNRDFTGLAASADCSAAC